MTHNPYVDVTKDTTTLYASDRDIFLFLVDDTHPIEAGRLPNGEPELFFRGFYAWNSEVGSTTLGIATFYLRLCPAGHRRSYVRCRTMSRRGCKVRQCRHESGHSPTVYNALRNASSVSSGL